MSRTCPGQNASCFSERASLYLKHWDIPVSLGVGNPRRENLAIKNGGQNRQGRKETKGSTEGDSESAKGFTGQRNRRDTERRQAAGRAPGSRCCAQPGAARLPGRAPLHADTQRHQSGERVPSSFAYALHPSGCASSGRHLGAKHNCS